MIRALFYAFDAANAPKSLSQAFITPVQSQFFLPSFGFAGGGSSRKRNREEAVTGTTSKEEEVVVLLNSDDEEEEKQRKRIMTFAASRRLDTNQQRPNPPATIPDEKDDVNDDGAGAVTNETTAEEDTARNRIMTHATAVNPERGISNNSLLAQLHAERLARRGPPVKEDDVQQQQQRPTSAGNTTAGQPKQLENPRSTHPTSPPTLTILSYNLWFNEEVEIYYRMQAISEIVSSAVPNDVPDILCFQEVTPLIYSILSNKPWWKQYTVQPTASEIGNISYFTVLLWKTNLDVSPRGGGGSGVHSNFGIPKYMFYPFQNSKMGRDMKTVYLTPYGIPIHVATSHLESPTGRQQLFSEPRQAQCKDALGILDRKDEDAIFIGDMNWNEKNDENPPLPTGWVDAWPQLHPRSIGYTYDTETNGMIKRGPWKLQLRLDRAFLKSKNWKLESIELLGKEALPGKRYDGKPVLPSDHFGLLVKLVAKPGMRSI